MGYGNGAMGGGAMGGIGGMGGYGNGAMGGVTGGGGMQQPGKFPQLPFTLIKHFINWLFYRKTLENRI